MNILNVTNATRYFLEKYHKLTGESVLNITPKKNTRYLLIKTNKRLIFFKYANKPYLKAPNGFADGIDKDVYRELLGLHNAYLLNDFYVCYSSGEIHHTDILNFAIYGFDLTYEGDGELVRVLNLNARDENNKLLFDRLK